MTYVPAGNVLVMRLALPLTGVWASPHGAPFLKNRTVPTAAAGAIVAVIAIDSPYVRELAEELGAIVVVAAAITSGPLAVP